MSAEIVPQVMDAAEARRVTERIRYTAMSVRDGMEKLQSLVATAQEGQAHIALGYKSWTAYLADVLGEEPMRLPRDERRELVAWLAGEGMSTRAIAPVVGAHHDTVASDIRAAVGNPTPVPTTSTASVPGPVAQESTSEQAVDGAAKAAAPGPQDGGGRMGASAADGGHADNSGGNRPAVTWLDGKTYTRPEPKTPRRADPKRGTDLHALKLVLIPALSAWNDVWANKTLLDDTVTAEEATQLLRDLSRMTPVLSQIRRLLNSRTGV